VTDTPDARDAIRQAITKHVEGIEALDVEPDDRYALMAVVPEVVAAEGHDPKLVDRVLRDDLAAHLKGLA
jgi:hypothetical protein